MIGPWTADHIAAVVDGQDLDKIKPISMPEQSGRAAQFSLLAEEILTIYGFWERRSPL